MVHHLHPVALDVLGSAAHLLRGGIQARSQLIHHLGWSCVFHLGLNHFNIFSSLSRNCFGFHCAGVADIAGRAHFKVACTALVGSFAYDAGVYSADLAMVQAGVFISHAACATC